MTAALLPPPLVPPARIGLIAPASPPRDAERLQAGIAALAGRGFEVVQARPSFPAHGYLCGTDAERLDELNAMLRRTDLGALFCVRGGYGVLRLLPHLDYEAARRHPKLLVGYSDITALHLALYAKAGWRGLSGLMVGADWEAPEANTERLFWTLARGGTPAPLLGPGGEALQPLRPGTAEGVLLGGTLSLLNRLLATPYLPPLDGAILYLEDVGEVPYRLDGLFAQLRLSGVLERLGGLVLGQFTETEPDNDRPTLSVDEVVADYVGRLAIPVAQGLVYGHIPVKNTMPVGVRARLTVTAGAARLDVLEPVVRPAP